ncbi:MAG TPA: cyclopropane-fatty-acyl-phospholipid synthase family protein [Gemmataceae bacterium]|nr:cyclopropane-fatty-acyl-phospholipid synthase family protein [Gemmataceae bacterium]
MTPDSMQKSPAHANGFVEPQPSAPSAGSPPAHRPGFWERLFRWSFPTFPVPLTILLWNGEEFATTPGVPIASVRFRERSAFLGALLNPDLGFGDGYTDGRIEVEGDLVAFLETAFRLPKPPAFIQFLRRLLTGWRLRPSANSLKRSRRNISHHYDLSNDFYQLWLDEQMVYTCAYFPTPDATLEEAQAAKMDHVCRKVWLRPGETVVEAGCGWGSLGRHMAKHYGVRVKAFNISHEQIRYARDRAKAEGLDGRVEYIEDDYRNITGQYDAFVSVGMLEHVGVDHYRELGGVIRRSLKPDGRGLVHSIGRNYPEPTSPWLEKRIFPGSYMPSLGEMTGVFEPCGLSILDVENLRLHYAKTLDHWLRRFEASADRIEQMFDRRLVRAYRLYLAASMVSFLVGSIQLFQIVCAPAASNEIPWSRAYVYDRPAGIVTR